MVRISLHRIGDFYQQPLRLKGDGTGEWQASRAWTGSVVHLPRIWVLTEGPLAMVASFSRLPQLWKVLHHSGSTACVPRGASKAKVTQAVKPNRAYSEGTEMGSGGKRKAMNLSSPREKTGKEPRVTGREDPG